MLRGLMIAVYVAAIASIFFVVADFRRRANEDFPAQNRETWRIALLLGLFTGTIPLVSLSYLYLVRFKARRESAAVPQP